MTIQSITTELPSLPVLVDFENEQTAMHNLILLVEKEIQFQSTELRLNQTQISNRFVLLPQTFNLIMKRQVIPFSKARKPRCSFIILS